MRLLAITDPGCPASTRDRVTQFKEYLEARDVQVQVLPWPGKPADNRAAHSELLASVAQAEVVLFQRYLPDSATLRDIRRRAARLVYDFDDAGIYTESTRRRSRRKLLRGWRFRRMVDCCDAVTAGNEYLAALARRHAQPARVHVLPTAVEPKRYEALPIGGTGSAHKSNTVGNGSAGAAGAVLGPTLGWLGSSSTMPYLERLRRPLEILSDEIPGLSVRVIADRQPDLGKTRVEWVRWSLDSEVEELKRLRVGLAPLPDDPWTRGKCNKRLLHYLAAEVPAVASPVGMQSQVTESGAALPARSDDEWVAALRRILSDPSLAATLTGRGSKLVRERFATPVLAESAYSIWCQLWLSIVIAQVGERHPGHSTIRSRLSP